MEFGIFSPLTLESWNFKIFMMLQLSRHTFSCLVNLYEATWQSGKPLLLKPTKGETTDNPHTHMCFPHIHSTGQSRIKKLTGVFFKQKFEILLWNYLPKSRYIIFLKIIYPVTIKMIKWIKFVNGCKEKTYCQYFFMKTVRNYKSICFVLFFHATNKNVYNFSFCFS